MSDEEVTPIRSYEEAVEITINFWVEKSFKTPLNQNNGDNSRNGFFTYTLLNHASKQAQDQVTDEMIEKFKASLRDNLLNRYNSGPMKGRCSVDYNPNQSLFDACIDSGISEKCLPIKTFTFINNDNYVEGRYQYGGEFFKL